MRDELVRDTVFISYRRNDRSSHVLTLKTLLCEALGESAVFHDVDMPAGTNFPIKLRGELDRAAVVLAVIGPEWLSSADAITGKRRLDDEKDWVRPPIAAHRITSPSAPRRSTGRRC